MPRPVICPSCQTRGSVRDEFQGGRITCRTCGQPFMVSGPTQGRGPAGAGRSGAAKPLMVFDDHENAKPEVPRPSRAGTRRGAPVQKANAGPSVPAIALLGAGGTVGLLLIVGLALWLSGGGSKSNKVEDLAEVQAAEADEVTSEPAPTPEPATVRPVSLSTASVNDPQEVVKRLKDATVYLKVKINGKPVSAGTGFVIEANGDTVLLATNRHVAVPTLHDLPDDVAPKDARVELEAVIRSGQGSGKEQVLPAMLVAADRSGDLENDLAFVAVKGVQRPPTPLVLAPPLTPSEGMAYTAAGFPLGNILGGVIQSGGNPSITITGGRVSALRTDEHGQLKLVQVDGSLQPGNSGGPIVEEKTGRLIGVAVAKVGAVDTIGFVVPADELRRALAGRIGALNLVLTQIQPDSASLRVKAELVDPKRQVKGVQVQVAPASTATGLAPNSDGTWPPLPGASPVVLQPSSTSPDASGEVKVPLSGQGPEARKVAVQMAYRDARGRVVYSRPKTVDLPEKPGPIGSPGGLERIIEALRKKSLAKLGPMVDPDQDCLMDKDSQRYKVTFTVPGNKVHTLSPEITLKAGVSTTPESTSKKSGSSKSKSSRSSAPAPLHNAPRSLMDVKGDFAAMVEVAGELNPGLSPTNDARVRQRLPITFQGAGLLLYQDKDNFLRLERCAGTAGGTNSVHRLLIELVQEGKQAMHPIYVDVPDNKLLLVLVRRKGKLRCLISPGNGKLLMTREFLNDFEEDVKIGLTAANLSKRQLRAEFENFAVLRNEEDIDQHFGE